MKKIIGLLFVFTFLSCRPTYYATTTSNELLDIEKEKDTNALVNVKRYSRDLVFDMKYATADNFLKKKVYPCEVCLLRVKTVKKLLQANKEFLEKGYRIKLFDCYRPIAIQKEMWKLVPNSNYVANPKTGSMHNKGNAVDVTLVDVNGVELPMGTAFDYFGEEAKHSYQNLPDTVIANRKWLKLVMEKNNFSSLNTEWWHYSLKGSKSDKVSNQKWECP